jgi:protein TonB
VKALATPLQAREPRPGREWLVYGALALATHAALLTAWRHGASAPLPVFHEQVVDLLRPAAPPPAVAEAPPPPPPPSRAQANPSPSAPVPALRTHAADSEVPPQALSVPENLTAAPSSEPVVAAPPAPPPAPPPVPRAEEPLTEATANAAYLKNPAPAYPAAAQRRGLQGTVLLRVHVQANGSADVVDVQQSSGHRLLDEAAVEAVRHWSFVPALRGKAPQAGWARVPVEFRLGS